MATYLHPAVEGETEEIVHQLLSDGEPFPILGLTVELILEKKDGTAIDMTGKITVLDDGSLPLRGKVKYSPAPEDWVKAGTDYFLRWKVTDSNGKIIYWPGGEVPKVKVYAVAHP